MPLAAVLGRRLLAPALLVAVLAVGASACHSDGDSRVRATPGACCAGPLAVASISGQSSPHKTAPAPAPPVHTLPRRIWPAAPVRRAPNRITGRQLRSSTATGVLDPGVLDPRASGRTYVLVRNTYRYDDPTGYAVALTAPGYTTAAFAARSRPTPTELVRVRLQDRSRTNYPSGRTSTRSCNSPLHGDSRAPSVLVLPRPQKRGPCHRIPQPPITETAAYRSTTRGPLRYAPGQRHHPHPWQ